MSPSPLRFPHSTPRRRRTPSTDPGDRFIPNRNLFDPAQSRASLLSNIEEDENISPAKVASVEYKRNLRRTLFGKDEPSSLLGFGDNATKSTRSNNPSVSVKDNFSLDPLRPLKSTHSKRTTQPKRSVSTSNPIHYDVPGLIPDSVLNLVSLGPAMAVGIDDSVFIYNEGTIDSVVFQSNIVSSVKWSTPTALLAMGIYNEAQVWDAYTKQRVARLTNHQNRVSALEWKGSNDLMAASDSGLCRYDIRLRHPELYRYPVHHQITKMQWNDNVLAAADGHSIHLWDARYSEQPLKTFQHANAKGLEFCPMQHNVLATGGSDGIHFWNVQSGELRATIPTPEPVTSLVWSPYRKEIMAAYGDDMAVWSLSSGVERLAQWGTDDGRVLALDRDPYSGRVASLHSYEHLYVWNLFGEPPKKRLDANLGKFKMSVIR